LLRADKLEDIDASKNYITGNEKLMINLVLNVNLEVDVHLVNNAPRLRQLNLEENPLNRENEQELVAEVTRCTVKVTKRETEDWEDLSL